MSPRMFPAWPILLLTLVVGSFGVLPCRAAQTAEQDKVLNRVKNSGILRVGVNPQFRPFSYTIITDRRTGIDKFIQARVGIDIDIAVLLARGLGVELAIVVPQHFEELIPMLRVGDIDIAIAALSRVFERALLVDFSEPYFHSGFSILLNRTKGYRIGIGEAQNDGEVKSALEAVGKENRLIVAVTRGKSAAGFIHGYFPLADIRDEYRTNEDAAAAVLSEAPGTPHLMVHDEIFLTRWHRAQPRRAQQKIAVFPEPFRSDTYGFAVAKGNLDFLRVLDLFIADKLVAEGRMAQFEKRRHYRLLPGIGIETIVKEDSANGTH